ncbi:Phosphatidylinositol-4-phosphate 5-kinase [Ascosphaera atra]|nr:Phosphatidylinositol-4-phosphate 5-kinase [Ascosphaera atra]
MAYGRKIHFVVMNNLFPPHRDIHQMFDLKGSTVGRDYREEDLARNPRATMKDLNWLRREKHLHCGPLRKDVFMAQLRRDVALLQRLNIMDYSLLVGMHDTRKGNDAKLRDRALQVYQPESNSGQFKGVGGEADAAAAAAAAEGSTQAQRPRESSDADAYEDGAELTAQGDRGSGVMSRSRRVRDSNTPVPLEQMREKSTEDILNQVHQLVFYSEEGGYRATNEEGEPIGEIYYLGIIDCLTTYGVVKKAENFWKGLSHNRNEISPIPPVGYAARFIEFIDQITKSPEQHAREREEREREKERQRALGLRPSISSDQAASGTTTPTQGNFLSHHGAHGPNNNNNNGNSHPNGKGKHGDSGGGTHHSHIFGTFNDNQGSHNSSAAVLPVVEEVPGESRNGSIRSQHASSMQIYENLMKGTSSRYEVRLSAAGAAGAAPARSPGSPPTSLTRASSERAGPAAGGLEMIGGGSIRRSFTVPDGGQITNLDGHMSDSGLTGIVEVSNFSGFDGGEAEDEDDDDGDGGRSRSADSRASDASYGAVVDAYGGNRYSANSGYGQQPHLAPRSDSNTPTADSSGPDDGYATDTRFDRLHPDAGAYFPREDDEDEYRTPPSSQTMHVPHMPPPSDVIRSLVGIVYG